MTVQTTRHFDQVYLINLPRRADKLSRVLWNLDRYHIQPKIIPAIDGYHPTIYYQQKVLPPGAYGYLLSWRKVIKDAIEYKHKRILVLDDDVIPIQNFNQKFDFWIQLIPKNWLLLLLGATQHATRPPLIQELPAYRPLLTDGSFAVALDHSLFPQLQAALTKNDLLVDSDILRGIYREHPEQCYAAFPNLMIADVTDSNIRESRSQEELASKIGWDLKLYHYPANKPLVSVIVPCYQAERTIKSCLNSLLNQTYRPMEIIVIEDGSTDSSFEIVCQLFQAWDYLEKAKGLTLKLLKHETNLGCYVTRNHGLDRATGDLIGFQDADDISLRYRIEDQVNHLLSKQVQFTTSYILRTHLHELSDDPAQLKKDIERTRIHGNKYCCRAKIGLITTLFRRELVQKLGKYSEWKWGADAEYLRRLFPDLDPSHQMMNYLNEIEFIPNLYYRVSEILYLSHEMTEQNLTRQRLKHRRQKIET